ncbi:MAG: nitrite reductase (NAD(P)H) small subunit [Candidatus Poribacteria bacterium]|nr:nitrite reductase (NAD(P)H) small subunit [Candidatus Poribacteria bacterium]
MTAMMTLQEKTWLDKEVALGEVEQIPVGEGRVFLVAGKGIAVFRARSGELFGVDDSCPHRGGPLGDGLLAGRTVVCPLHGKSFNVRTGECLQGDVDPVNTYPVREENGSMYLTLRYEG